MSALVSSPESTGLLRNVAAPSVITRSTAPAWMSALRTMTGALLPMIHREPAQESDRDRMIGLALRCPRRCLGFGDASRGDGVVAGDSAAAMNDVGSRAIAGLALQGMTLQPEIERRMRPAVEVIDGVLVGEEFDCR